MCMDTIRLLSTARNASSARSDRSAAVICKNDALQNFSPILNVRPSGNSNDAGAIKSRVDSPDGASQSQSNANGSFVSMWKMPCSSASRALPSSACA